MKPDYFIYLLLSAFILPLNAQTFPQPELWLRDTAAQVINPVTDSVLSYEVPNSVAYTVYSVMRSDEPDSSQVLWYLTSGDSVLHGVLTDGVFSAGGVLRSSQSRDFSRYSIYHYRQSMYPDSLASLTFNLGPCDSLPSRILFDELAYFPRSLTRNENAVFLTLLAIRHGITLTEVPYVTPLLDTLWHPVRDERFCHRITGIGWDSISGLAAVTSRSREEALVSLSATHLSEGAYALVGDDDNGRYFALSDTLYRMARTWRVRTHNLTTPISLCADVSLSILTDTLMLGLLDEAGWVRAVILPDSTDAELRACYALMPDTLLEFTFLSRTCPDFRQEISGANNQSGTASSASATYLANEQSIAVSYNLPTDAPVTCMLYDSAGKYIITFSGSSSAALARITLPSGVYHLRLIQSGLCVATAKLIIL